jgi:hypothetical protein
MASEGNAETRWQNAAVVTTALSAGLPPVHWADSVKTPHVNAKQTCRGGRSSGVQRTSAMEDNIAST